MRTNHFFLLFILMLLTARSWAQTPSWERLSWKIIKNKDSIQVYVAKLDTSEFNPVRVTAIIPGKLEKFESIIRDVDSQKKWIENVKISEFKRMGKDKTNEYIYYSMYPASWPVSDRDVFIDLIVSKDTNKNSIHVICRNISDPADAKQITTDEKRVRITSLQTELYVTEKSGLLTFDYYIHVNPAGSLPAWLVNLLSRDAPYNTFQKLKILLK